ncbi:MAG: pyridoxamine 5'-phosphate oxidase family protein [Dehalococcoidia bacterium]
MPTKRTTVITERPQVPEGYGLPDGDEGMLQWEWAEDRLTAAQNYWISTVRPDGRPHVTPVWGVWYEGALYFDGSDQTRRMKNIAANPEIAVHLESGDEVVIIEGSAASEDTPPARSLATKLAELYTAKYSAHSYAPSPDQWDGGGLYVLRPRKALGWTLRPGDEFGKTYTRWRFSE